MLCLGSDHPTLWPTMSGVSNPETIKRPEINKLTKADGSASERRGQISTCAAHHGLTNEQYRPNRSSSAKIPILMDVSDVANVLYGT